MEFDELYATRGNSDCKAAETFRLSNRVSYQGMVSGFGIFIGPAAPRSQIGSASPSFRSSSLACMPFRNLTLVYLLVILVQIGFSCRATLIMSPYGDIRNVPFWRRYDNRNVP